jgi:hypothetical protein
VGEMAIEGLDVERTKGGIDVVRCEGCATGMAREACCLLGTYKVSANMRTFGSTRLETKNKDVLARPGVSGILRHSPAFPRFRLEGC